MEMEGRGSRWGLLDTATGADEDADADVDATGAEAGGSEVVLEAGGGSRLTRLEGRTKGD